MPPIATIIYTFLYGTLVGSDSNGNRYYQHRTLKQDGKLKRWVIYAGDHEPTSIPPTWHGWMHYMTDIIPDERYSWQKDPEVNMTGTDKAYYPTKHVFNNQFPSESAPYEAWCPDSDSSENVK